MDAQSTLNATEKTAVMRLAGPCATEHAAPLAAAWMELLAQVDAARSPMSPMNPQGGSRSQEWVAILDFSEMTGVGLAFFEVTAAAAKALARRGMVLSRQGTLPESLHQAAKISGFAAVPALSGLFSTPENHRPPERP